MNAINTVSKIVCVTLVVGAAVSAISYADPGNMEAINSASSDLRNIIGVEILRVLLLALSYQSNQQRLQV
jgi:hypothetical protein